ncbi:tail protein X [Altericroceibacterium endophyticum]|uniref:Phage tail protein n=1 Tax=Altericroceibacterium endophyticum TaxID=1808508 RepID=A0A6I4T812_9SPHN|nr:tail protein X [Altericroceibacterium endophyticum]MXO66241.1 phage tail protein [Altericroceibacterium endophyticum]
MAETFTATARQDETLDELCWRVLGQTERVTEQALTLNRNLADQGELLREGQEVILPIVTALQVPTRKVIQLWD